jgi:Cu+-exporting ATPase
MAIDPICGMTVDEATARSAEKDGQTSYFCSDHCRQKFLASDTPNTKQPDAHQTQTHHDHHLSCCHAPTSPPTKLPVAAKYICPMDPEVQSDQPGKLSEMWDGPGIGSTRGPPAGGHLHLPDAPADRARSSGQCPICGMDLEPKTVQPDAEEDDSELRSMTRAVLGCPPL